MKDDRPLFFLQGVEPFPFESSEYLLEECIEEVSVSGGV